MKEYNKLVRDRIPEIIINNGAKPVTRTLTDEEYFSELNKKLGEEVAEYLESKEIEELADIEEIIKAILDYQHVNENDFEQMRLIKADKRGSFKKRIFLEREE